MIRSKLFIDYFNYTVNNFTKIADPYISIDSLKKEFKTAKRIVIPEEIEGLKVLNLENSCFKNCEFLEKVQLNKYNRFLLLTSVYEMLKIQMQEFKQMQIDLTKKLPQIEAETIKFNKLNILTKLRLSYIM